jgi:hypothetical protein
MKKVLLLALCAVSPWAAAWTSGGGPLFESIHQTAIEHVLGSSGLRPEELQLLESEQTRIDLDQRADQSQEHSMTGVMHGDHYSEELRQAYITRTEILLRNNFASGIALRIAGHSSDALKSLAVALHALQDATSPAHEGFQPWSDDFGLWEMIRHALKERAYPSDGADKRNLEGVVLFAYDIYCSKIPAPTAFFDHATGMLLLPKVYLTLKKVPQ